MRFLENGPDIPDELLNARDEGRVVFFCGAGVSMARAGLPDFFSLAEGVIDHLGVLPDSPVKKLLAEAKEINDRVGIGGLISVDRIFGLLEREFAPSTIESAVAKALKPDDGSDLSAHRILLNLATTSDGKVRLVTTNFDRLFSDCDSELAVWQPPRLPNPERAQEMNGIIHLHGCANQNYSGPEEDGFVLSSSEFGRAYLSEGWATSFVKDILDKYVVVFIGYAAEDPPVQYLLEALNKKEETLGKVYAFQAQTSGDAAASWRHKGVHPINYDPNNEHSNLWNTLSSWSVRAENPEKWVHAIISMASKGPEVLAPHERGQVAHLLSTSENARQYAFAASPPPAEWLCVFDPARRYGNPRHLGGYGERETFIDPFDLYGLDSDVPPSKIDPEDYYASRDVPTDAWDGLRAIRTDRESVTETNMPSVRGHWSANPARLPTRLSHLTKWFEEIAYQPAAVWWAAHQSSLHPEIINGVRRAIERSDGEKVQNVVRQAWGYLFEAWEAQSEEFRRSSYELEIAVKKYGWDGPAIRRFSEIEKPYLSSKVSFNGSPKPPDKNDEVHLRNLVRLDVEYPVTTTKLKIPTNLLPLAASELRKNLEFAVQLENELGGYGLSSIQSITPDARAGDGLERSYGISATILRFTNTYDQLVEQDKVAAIQELLFWPKQDNTVFAMLRIWVAGKLELISNTLFAEIILGLSEKVFWDQQHQWDLLNTFLNRWGQLPKSIRTKIEKRLTKRLPKSSDEDDIKHRAWLFLDRVHWLKQHGCAFSDTIDGCFEKSRKLVPKWTPRHSDRSVESSGSSGGWVKTDSEHSALLKVPLHSVISEAKRLTGRADDFLVERDPFSGLCKDSPARALGALRASARNGLFPEWAWQSFLSQSKREGDKVCFSALIAKCITQYPCHALLPFLGYITSWLSSTAAVLSTDFEEVYDHTVSKLIEALLSKPAHAESNIVQSNKEPDWLTEAINSPAGELAEAMVKDSRLQDIPKNDGFPAVWTKKIESLLSLEGDPRRYVIAILARQLNWLSYRDPDWTSDNVLSVLEGDDLTDQAAFWSGLFWSGRKPSEAFYRKLKPYLLKLALSPKVSEESHDDALSGLILSGWGTNGDNNGTQQISNQEMRAVLVRCSEQFRLHTLYHLDRWSAANETDLDKRWRVLLLQFLTDIWPKQLVAKSPKTSAQLCNIAFSHPENFPEIVDAISPHLSKIDHGYTRFMDNQQESDSVATAHPWKVLDILSLVLGEDTSLWPYNISTVFDRMVAADAHIKRDDRFIELLRKWNSS